MVRVPWLPATHGVTTDAFAELLDVYPTLAELAGTVPDQADELDGKSLASLFTGDTATAAELPEVSYSQYIRCHHPDQPTYNNDYQCTPEADEADGTTTTIGYSVRVPRWRYTVWLRYSPRRACAIWRATNGVPAVVARELYSHFGDDGSDFDAFENDNVAGDPQHATVIEALHRMAVARFGACLPLPPCPEGRFRVNGRCVRSLSCRARTIQSGSMTGEVCRCADRHCHYCTRAAAGDTCRRCRDAFYQLDNECVRSCPATMASSGISRWGRRCLTPFICQSGSIQDRDVSYGCKCPEEGNLAIAACHRCEHRAGEYGQHCTKCNSGRFLFENRCTRQDCEGLWESDGLVSYNPGNYGRQCRAPFLCTDRVDEDGAACKCPRAVGRNDCTACSYDADGVVCERCTNGKFLRNGACVNACRSGETPTGSGADGRECV